MARFFPVSTAALLVLTASLADAAEPHRADIVVYGGTSAGVAAALQASRMGKSVALIEPTDHLGGLTTNGLGATDSGRKETIGGISRDFYRRVQDHYRDRSAWNLQDPAEAADKGGRPLFSPEARTMWVFEPKVAQAIMDGLARESRAEIVYRERLDRGKGVRLEEGRIVSITMESGLRFEAAMFIDATYEGDLLAAAGVSFHVGREANSVYGETLNGVQKKQMKGHLFTRPVDPYVVPGDPSSGLVARVSPEPPGEDGSGDRRLQAFNFRMCMSDDPRNRVPFPKPEGYDEADYELLFRNFEAGDLRLPWSPSRMPNHKTDTNNYGAFSTDNIGMNHDYAEASHEDRARIVREHETYQKGLMWTLANHPRVPGAIREAMEPWGLAADEFVGNGNWPRQIYVREARRMVSDYVVTELDCRRVRVAEDPVGLGSYNMDSHNVQRYVDEHGKVQNEGDVQVSPGGPYAVSYRSIVPKRGEAANLLVPVCVSSSHIAFGSIRMEPVFMILGQSAATAAVMAMERGVAVQDLPYAELRKRLLEDGQVLDLPPDAAPRELLTAASLPGIVVDDAEARAEGEWVVSTSATRFVGNGYRHDAFGTSVVPETKRLVFPVKLPESGNYEVRIAFPAHGNRATRARIRIQTASGEVETSVNQREKKGDENGFVSLGVHAFTKGVSEVSVSNEEADGYVVADAIQFLPAKP
ncbi:MAG: FAD-dependent oxidoreductase [Verrucomicrobiales bacterium]|nr:FAD-dependent oxidoreductase [Verrucomicrobiales bacterium]